MALILVFQQPKRLARLKQKDAIYLSKGGIKFQQPKRLARLKRKLTKSEIFFLKEFQQPKRLARLKQNDMCKRCWIKGFNSLNG